MSSTLETIRSLDTTASTKFRTEAECEITLLWAKHNRLTLAAKEYADALAATRKEANAIVREIKRLRNKLQEEEQRVSVRRVRDRDIPEEDEWQIMCAKLVEKLDE